MSVRPHSKKKRPVKKSTLRNKWGPTEHRTTADIEGARLIVMEMSRLENATK